LATTIHSRPEWESRMAGTTLLHRRPRLPDPAPGRPTDRRRTMSPSGKYIGVGDPVRTAYKPWNQFKYFPEVMEGVNFEHTVRSEQRVCRKIGGINVRVWG